jgi:hypothetical protein
VVWVVKNLTLTKRIFLEWARSRYGPGVRFVKRGAVDFVLPDGTRVIVKRPVRGFLYFTENQWRGLSPGDLVAVVEEDRGVVGMVPFSELGDRKTVVVGGRSYTVLVERHEYRVLRIRCSRETYERLEKVVREMGGYEDTLRYLLDLYDAYGRRMSPRVF